MVILPTGLNVQLKRKFPFATLLLSLSTAVISIQCFVEQTRRENRFIETLDRSELARVQGERYAVYLSNEDRKEELFELTHDFSALTTSPHIPLFWRSEGDPEFAPFRLSSPQFDSERDRIRDQFRDTIFAERGIVPAHLKFDFSTVKRLVSYLFIHSDFLHLFSNLIFLILLGTLLESLVGSGPMVLIYLFGGALSGIGEGVVSYGSELAIVGASGAITTLLGLFVVAFHRAKIRLWVWFFPFPWTHIVFMRSYWLVGAWVAIQLFGLFAFDDPRTAYGAHLTGLALGMALGLRFHLHRRSEEDLNLNLTGDDLSLFLEAESGLKQGYPTLSETFFRKLLQKSPGDPYLAATIHTLCVENRALKELAIELATQLCLAHCRANQIDLAQVTLGRTLQAFGAEFVLDAVATPPLKLPADQSGLDHSPQSA